jgi:hypothetical protein
MTSFEATLWVAGGLFVGSLVFAGIGGFFEERGQNDAQNASFIVAMALFGMSAVSAAKALLSLVIN